ncbi:hypothetical protein GCM10027436_89100 [Actinophytocola sediminis]
MTSCGAPRVQVAQRTDMQGVGRVMSALPIEPRADGLRQHTGATFCKQIFNITTEPFTVRTRKTPRCVPEGEVEELECQDSDGQAARSRWPLCCPP